ncbi:MAG: AMP-binding protein [Lutimonas sp.]
MSLAGIHSSFTFDGQSFDTESGWIEFMDHYYPKGSELLQSWFAGDRIQVKTSGSTGVPKTISFTREQMTESARATGQFFDLGERTRALLCLPLDYIAGKMMLIRAMTLGWHLEGVQPGIQLDLADRGSFDFAAMIPLQVENNLKSLDRIKTLIVGGAPVNWKLQERIKFASTRIYATYGMTETITHIALRPLNQSSKQKISSGNRSLVDEVYSSLPGVSFDTDARGCLVVRCPRISDTEIVTNDLVDLVSHNSFIWLGRIDNVINSGGLKLMPEIIEQKFSRCVSGRFFAAGLPDSELGERMIFVVEGRPENELLDRLKSCQVESAGSIMKYEVPKEIVFVAKFAETDSGKMNRKRTLDLIRSSFT